MPREELPPDPDAVEEWKKLPQSEPSREAMPPATGGSRWTWVLLIFFGIVIVITILTQLPSG